MTHASELLFSGKLSTHVDAAVTGCKFAGLGYITYSAMAATMYICSTWVYFLLKVRPR